MNFKNYTAFFCEENIWQLVNSITPELLGNFTVLFLTNESKSIALMNQKAAKGQTHIIWDYHVILHDLKQEVIFDYDSTLCMPSPLEEYFEKTFGRQDDYLSNFRTAILAISATQYLEEFSSDRKHMIDMEGQQVSPFPEWPKIDQEGSLCLPKLINLDEAVLKKHPLLSIEDYLKAYCKSL